MDTAANPELFHFISYLQFEKRYSRHTVRAYDDDLQQFFAFIRSQYGGIALADISSPIIRSWLASLKAQGISSRSINRKISSLKSFFKYLLRTGNLNQTPMANIISPKAAKRLPSFAGEEDMARMLEQLKQSDTWKSLNARMLITLFYCTGMRLSELVNLRQGQVDKGKCVIKVLGKGNKERIIPISAQIVHLIGEYEASKLREFGTLPEDSLLVTEKGRKLYPKYVYLLVKEYLGDIKTLDKKSPHILRHSFATHLSNQGADLNAIKELLGHASLAATQVYTHNSIEKLKNVYKKSHPKA